MAQKKQINLYLQTTDIELLNSIANGIKGSRSNVVNLLLNEFIKDLGEKDFREALKKGTLNELLAKKRNVELLGNMNYDYTPVQ